MANISKKTREVIEYVFTLAEKCLPGFNCEKPVKVEVCNAEIKPEIDIEPTGWICRDGTWQKDILTFTDGILTNTTAVDSGISCDEVMPVDFEIEFTETCKNAIGADVPTIHKQAFIYSLTDPTDPSTAVQQLLGSEIDTGIKCNEEPLEAEVFVVRLDGSKTGPSTDKIEGDALIASDIGNTFTLTGEYLSYVTQWLGDTEQNAVLDWNNISYLAGIGGGSAGYAHASLPALTDSENLIHDDEIILTANAGAFVEFRFKRLQ